MTSQLVRYGLPITALSLVAWCALSDRDEAATLSSSPLPRESAPNRLLREADSGKQPARLAKDALALPPARDLVLAPTLALPPPANPAISPTFGSDSPGSDIAVPLPGCDDPTWEQEGVSTEPTRDPGAAPPTGDHADTTSVEQPTADAGGLTSDPVSIGPLTSSQAAATVASRRPLASEGCVRTTGVTRGLVEKTSPRGTEIASVGSNVRVTSHQHVVDFGAAGFAFTPRDEAGSPRPSARVSYGLESVSRGRVVVVADAGVAPTVTANQVSYERAPGFLEHYLVFDDGIEQLFSFAQIPQGIGDLVIRGRVATALEARVSENGEVRFSGENHVMVTFGKVRACDGGGRVVEAEYALSEGGALEIRVPGEWLVNAKGPLLVDPLIDSEYRVTKLAGNEEHVALAYNPVDNEFLLAYVSGQWNLCVSRLDGLGRLVTTVVLDNQLTTKGKPTVAWSESGVGFNRYLVAYCGDDGGFDNDVVFVAVLDNVLGIVSAPARIYNPAGWGEVQGNPSVAYDSSNDRWLVVWDDDSTSASPDILMESVTVGGTQGGQVILRNLSSALQDPSIAFSLTSSRYLVSYVEEQISGEDLEATLVTGALAISTHVTIDSSAGVTPSNCWSATTNEFWTGYKKNSDIVARRVSTTGTVNGTTITIADESLDWQVFSPYLSYNSASDSILAAYVKNFNANQYDILIREYRGTNATAVAAAQKASTATPTQERLPAIAANTVSTEWLVCWEDFRAVTDLDVWAHRYSTETTAPTVVRFEPQHDSTGWLLNRSTAIVEFSHDMDSATINTTNIKLFQGGATPITTYTVTYLPGNHWALLSLSGNWPTNQSIRVSVGPNVTASGGTTMGVTKEATFYTGASATLVDADLDGLLDVEETALGLNPSGDTDGDGVADWNEIYEYHTDPFQTDTDHDSIADNIDPTPRGNATDSPYIPTESLAPTLLVTNIVPTGTLGSPAEVPDNTNAVVTFNNPVNSGSFTSSNITLQDQSTFTNVTLALDPSPNPRTLILNPSSALVAGRTYLVTVTSGGSAVMDLNGNRVSVSATSAFKIAAPTGEAQFEATHNDTTLAMTGWETFPLLAPTASGRMGEAHVVPSTRKLFVTETDVSTPGRGITVDITRVHRNNDNAASGTFGNNWHFSYDRSFTSVTDETSDGIRELRHRSADGRLFTYKSVTNALAKNYTSPPGFYDTLKVETVGGNKLLVQRTKHGVEFFYEFHLGTSTTVVDPDALTLGSVGYLVRIRDANRNVVVLNRAAADHASRPNRIESIVDDLDRTTTFTYSATAGQLDLCAQIQQFTGAPATRNWLYTYDGSRSLIRVETPPTDFSDEGTPVTATRKDRQYTYTTSGGVYSLTSIEDGRDNVSFRVFYDGNRDVTQVDYGSGAQDVGTAIYSFRRLTGVSEATQIDRNGNVLMLEHENVIAAPFWTIKSERVYTKGLHPNTPLGEPTSYLTKFTHDTDTQIVEHENKSLTRWIRDAKGNVLQFIRKAATSTELTANGANYKREEDIVVDCAYEAGFNRIKRMTEPRGNNVDFVGTTSTIVTATESVSAQTARTFAAANVDEVKRNAYTKFFYYDHEDVSTRLTSDTTAIGDTVSLVRQLPKSYGRTAANATRDPPDAAFNDADSDNFPDRGGNLYVIRDGRPFAVDRTTGALGGTRQVVEHNFTFNQWGQRIISILPDGDRHRLEYHVGAFNLTTNPQRGYLKAQVVATHFTDLDMDLTEGDVASEPTGTGLELATTFSAYDVFGNVLTVTNPRGFSSTLLVNKLNLVTKTTSPLGYDVEYVHDANNNLVEVQIENVVANDTNDDGLQGAGESLTVAAHPEFVHEFTYSTANMLSRQDLDAYGSTPSTITATWEYDRKQHRVGMRQHEGNTHVWRYDERDLLYESVEGANDTSLSETTTYDYDQNGNLVQTIDDDGNMNPALSVTYDIFDRAVSVSDELGNHLDTTFDIAGFPRQEVVIGYPRGGPGEEPTSYLSNTMIEFDELGRPFQWAKELFGAQAALSTMGLSRLTPVINVSSKLVDGGEVTTTLEAWGKCSCPKGWWFDNLFSIKEDQDAANRTSLVTDSFNSSVEITYDKNSNAIRTAEVEKSDDGTITQTYFNERFFDEQDRPMAAVSHGGRAERLLYDSRGNVLQRSDAMGTLVAGLDIADLPLAAEHGTFPQTGITSPTPDAAINARGNTVRNTYDGLGRRLSTIRDMRSDGTGAGALLTGQEIVTSQSWDGNSRLSTQTDPNGNVTSYGYDSQNRLILTQPAEPWRQRQLWNRVDTLLSSVDQRLVTTTYTYDAAERRTAATIGNLPPGQEQTTFLAWRHDGLGRMTQAEDNDTITELYYDSMSREVRDVQKVSTGAPRTTSAGLLATPVTGDMRRVYDGVGNLLRQTYPSNTVVNRANDLLGRLTQVTDAVGTVATFKHIGLGGRRLSRTYPTPNITASYTFDGDRQVTRLDHVVNSSSQRVRGFSYAWDRAGNRRSERRLTVNTTLSEAGGPGEFFKYDSAYRLVHADRDVTSANLDLVLHNKTTVTPPPVVSSAASDFVYDRAGNRQQTTIDATSQLYEMRVSTNEFDAGMNQYTRIGSTIRTHDNSGNLISSSESGGNRMFFDAQDQFVQWTDATKDVRYRYDALGRRVSKRMVAGGSTWTLYFWDGWQVVEETTSAGVVQRRYVYGEGIDEPIRATLTDVLDLDGDSSTTDMVDVYYHENSLGSIVALTKNNGTVVESYRYDPFGKVSVYNQAGTLVAGTLVQQPYMFTGRALDWEEGSGLYYYRLRYYDPAAGRFISRDPMGLWGDPGQRGNGQSYCGNNPINWTDPLGETSIGETLASALSGGRTRPSRRAPDRRPDPSVIDTLAGAATGDARRGTGQTPPPPDGPLEDVGEVLIDLTWGSFNTALSGVVALINLTFGNIFAGVDELCGKPFGIDWAVPNFEFEDIIVIEGGLWDIFGGEMTLGVFVMSETGFIYTIQRSTKRVPPTIAEHAEGHHDQCELWGPFYFFRIGLSSFWSALTNGRWHRWHWTEVGADDWAGQLFGPTRAGKRP